MVKMKVLSSLLLAGCVLLMDLSMVSTASAQDTVVFAPPGEFELLPTSQVVGDGKDSTQMVFVALGSEGDPLSGLKLKAKAEKGKVGSVTEVNAGVYSFQFTAPKVESSQDVLISVKGKTSGKETFEASESVHVLATVGANIQVKSDPPEIVLGQGTEATLTFDLVGLGASAQRSSDLVISSSAGEVSNLTPMGDGRYTARFTPPNVNYPHLAVLTVAHRSEPNRVFGQTVIPLLGKLPYPVPAPAGASVLLAIGGRTFGPVVADEKGKSSVLIVVKPGQTTATKIIVDKGKKLEEPIDLRVPDTRRIVLFPIVGGAGADGASTIEINAFIAQGDGNPDESANVIVDLGDSKGTLSKMTHKGGGIYGATYVTPISAEALVATVDVSIGNSSIQKETAMIRLVGQMPASISVSAEPRVLTVKSKSLKLLVDVAGADGKGVGSQSVVFYPAGATLRDSVEDLKGGTYQGKFDAGDSSVAVLSTLRIKPTGAAVHHLMLTPMYTSVVNNPERGNLILVMATDERGYPVAGVEVALSVGGDGTIDETVTTDQNGVAAVNYKAGRRPGIVEINASSGDLRAGTAFVQAPEGVGGVSVPTSGTSAHLGVVARWSNIIKMVEIEREGATSTTATAVAIPDPENAVDSLVVTMNPPVGEAGGSVMLFAKVLDQDGAGMSGQVLAATVGSGVVTEWTEIGDGAYQASYRIASTSAGAEKISIYAGSVTKEVVLLVTGDSGKNAAEKTAKVKKVKKVRSPVDTPATRVGASLLTGNYLYQQTPFTFTGPLLPYPLRVGGSEGSSPAHPIGIELMARGFVPQVGFLAYDVALLGSSYSLTADEFGDAVVKDGLYRVSAQAVGQVPFDLSGARAHLGLRAGFEFEDYLMWSLLVEDDGSESIEYTTLSPWGVTLGLEGGVVYGKADVLVSYNRSFAYFTSPHAHTYSGVFSYDVTDTAFISAGLSSRARQILLVGQESGTEHGEIVDSQRVLKFGIGLKL